MLYSWRNNQYYYDWIIKQNNDDSGDNFTLMVNLNCFSVTFRSLVDTVYALRDQVRELQNQVTSLAKEVELLKNTQP